MSDDFNWEESNIPLDFFNDSPEEIEKKTDSEKVQEESEEVDKREKSLEELADEIFDDEKPRVKTKEKEEYKSEKKEDTPSVFNILAEKGIIELEDGEELTEENIIEKYEESVDNKIEELFSELPDKLKQLNKFALQGGDINRFFDKLKESNDNEMSSDLDLDDEYTQEFVVKEMLASEGYDEEYIETQIEFLKEKDKLKSTAEKKFSIWQEAEDKKQEKILAKEQDEIKKNRDKFEADKKKLIQSIKDKEEILGFKLSVADKKDLPAYIMDRNIKLDNGGSISGIHRDIYEVMNNEGAVVQLAKLLRARKEDGTFDFSSIEKKAKSELSEEVRKNVRRNTQTKDSEGSSQKNLEDYF